jgi:RNA polymerase sigma factor (sigma-70 family)
LDDLIGYGSIGLVRALEAFDPTTGYSFTTFAKPAIVREIINQLQYEDIIRPKSNDKKKLKAGEISKYNFCSTDELIIGIENTTIGESISGDCYDSLFEFDEQNSFQKEDEFWDYLKEVIKLPGYFDLARAKYSLAVANGKRIKVSEQDIADMNGYTKQNVSGKLQILLKQLRKDPKLRKWWEQNKMNY